MFKPMLASPLNEDAIKAHLLVSPLFMSPKLDGIRALNLEGQLLSRSLKLIPNLHARSMFENYLHYDGELIAGEPNAPDVYRKTNSAVMSIQGEPDLTFWVFDHVETPTDPYSMRYTRLTNSGKVRCLPQRLVKTFEEVLALEQEFLEQGFEGGMLRRGNAPYKFGRATEKSLDLHKLKRDTDEEALIVEVYEAIANDNQAYTDELGRTKRSTDQAGRTDGLGMVGGFVLDKGGIRFRCSAGQFNHSERRALWNSRDSLPGRYLKYRSFGYGVKDAPRFPRALGFRDPIDMS